MTKLVPAITATRGFTLTELMITLVLSVIVLTMAVPGFRDVVQDNVATSQINEFVSAVNLARSEAVKRANNITLCKSANGTSCDTGSTGWQQGWIIFLDTDADSVVDSGETILNVSGSLPGNVTLTGQSGSNVENFITYRSNGSTTLSASGGEVKIILCDSRADATATKAVAITPTGRIRTMPGNASSLTCS